MTKSRFFIQRDETEAGPYDLVQMAGLLRKHIIDSETPTRLEGDDAWKPFSWQPQFSVVREMSPDAPSMHLDELNEQALDQQSSIPLPSSETLFKIGAVILGGIGCGLGAFCLTCLDHSLGIGLICFGLGIGIAAQVMVIVKMLDEDWFTLGLIFCMPLYDLYYLITRFDQYALLLAIKYGALCIFIGAGLAIRGQ